MAYSETVLWARNLDTVPARINLVVPIDTQIVGAHIVAPFVPPIVLEHQTHDAFQQAPSRADGVSTVSPRVSGGKHVKVRFVAPMNTACGSYPTGFVRIVHESVESGSFAQNRAPIGVPSREPSGFRFSQLGMSTVAGLHPIEFLRILDELELAFFVSIGVERQHAFDGIVVGFRTIDRIPAPKTLTYTYRP
eukprot:scaffold769_cov278-Pavlova_lutheri.AAC.3